MSEVDFDDGKAMQELFFDKNYVEQSITLPSSHTVYFFALKAAMTDIDLTGQLVWPGCTMLLNWLDRNVNRFVGKNVIELGAGTAACSIFLRKYGNPRLVIATDGSESIVELIQKNIDFQSQTECVRCFQMKWDMINSKRVVEEFGHFDYVIGSEIAYDENCIESLVDTMDSLLAMDGRFIIGHIDRYAKTTRALHAKLLNSGFLKEEMVDWDSLMPEKMELIEGSVMVWKRDGVKLSEPCFLQK